MNHQDSFPRHSPFERTVRNLLLAVISATLLIMAACGGGETAKKPADRTPAGTPAGPQIEVQDVHIQLLADNGSIYLTVVNSGNEEDRLLRVETPLATTAETHETVDEDGVLRMLPRPEGFVVPAGGQLSLAPGGKHVMLLGLTSSEESPAETSAPLTLHFEHSGSLQVEGHVMRSMGRSENDGGGQHDH